MLSGQENITVVVIKKGGGAGIESPTVPVSGFLNLKRGKKNQEDSKRV